MSTSTATSSVDPSLWWDPFSSLLSDLENCPLSSDLSPSLATKLKENHLWFVETVNCFKPQNAKSKEALNSQKVKIGSRELVVKPELKEKALYTSSYLCLDEVQSYILVQRSVQRNDFVIDSVAAEYLHLILLHYYIERQCLLKCTRQILMHALYVGIRSTEENTVRDEALKLIADGLEHKSISVLQGLLYSSHPEQMDVDLFTLWAEETLIEDNLVLDIIFLIYYESLSNCTCESWKDLCLLYKGILSGSCNFEKLAISNQALKSSYHAKIQLLLILIETLDLENLLQLLHDEIPFRKGACNFSLTDIQEMDTLLSSFDSVEIKEVGPLIHAWAVYLRLILSLSETKENNVLMEIDHDGYIRLAFEVASLSYFVEILDSDLLKESDGPIAGYRSVLRTFISAFIACYEINLQLEDSTLNLILDFICKVYRGEESLCVQFWDKNSFVDGPIRCLLCNFEGEFPVRTVELVRFLSSLCEGSWPAECVYNFLDKSVGISTLFEVTSECLVDSISHVVETHMPLHIHGLEGLVIPSKTRGLVLKYIDGNTALVRWEYAQSGVLVLLLRLAQEMFLESNEEVILTFDLLRRLVSSNMGVAFSLMDVGNSFFSKEAEMNGCIEKNTWVVQIICHAMRNLSPSPRGAALMSMGVGVLSQMLNCAPAQVVGIVLKANIFEMASKPSMFDVGYDGLSSGSWFVSGKLANLLLIDSEQNDHDTPLAISVLDFTMQLLETRVENELVLALVVFSLQYIMVNHEYWKYKARHIRWKVTLKVLEVMKNCIIAVPFFEKLGVVVRDMLLIDSYIHNALFRLSCTTKQTLEKLYVNRHFELLELEGFQLAVGASLDILYSLLSKFSKDIPSSLSVFHQAVLSSSTKPVPAVAITSLISYSRDPAIQIAAAKVLSSLFIMADCLQLSLSSNACFALEDEEITDLRHCVESVLLKASDWNEDLFFAIMNLLTSAARHQPAFLVAILFSKEDIEVHLGSTTGVHKPKDEVFGVWTPMKSSLIDSLMEHVGRSNDYINSNPHILLSVVEFLMALWEGAVQYITILEFLKGSEKFWKMLDNCIAIVDKLKDYPAENLSELNVQHLVWKSQCQSAILEIIAYEMFLQKKLLHAESLLKDASETNGSTADSRLVAKSNCANDRNLKHILMKWCEKSILENLVKSYTSYKYNHEVSYHAKVASSLFMVHVMGKLASGNAGSLSFSLIEQINVTFKNLSGQPGFSELLAQYSQRGYSEGRELTILVLNDLYYHIQGELEGRKIVSGPFKDLLQFLVDADCLQKYRHVEKDEHFAYTKHTLYDLKQLQSDLRMDMWEHTDWKASKETAEIMLNCMQDANSMIMLANSTFSALKALTTVLILFEDNSLEKKTTARVKIPSELSFSCIDHICDCLRSTVESLARCFDATEEMIDCLAAQAELLLHFMRSVQSNCSLSVCVVVLQTSCTCLKVLCDVATSVTGIKRLVKLLLMILLLAIEFAGDLDEEFGDFVEVSNVCLQVLPILCNCITTTEYSAILLSTIDLILRSFLTPRTWFPIIRKHLQLQHVIVILQDKRSCAFVPTVLKFLLTLARVRGGAEMLLNAGFFSAIKVLFADLTDGWHSTVVDANSNGSIASSDKTEKPQQIWGLGLAVITAMVHSLGESSFCNEIMDYLIPYLFSEKAYLISYHIRAPEFPSEDHNRKRQRPRKTQTSLFALKETEHTLMLMCTLAKNWNTWTKTTREMDSQLREKAIHLLAFFSRGIHRFGDSSGRVAPIFCPPILKEDFECCNKPSFVKSKNGWFSISPLCCMFKPKLSGVSVDSTAFVIRGESIESTNNVTPTYFSDLVALQIYKNIFLVLKFLCIEAEGAANRSAEVGYLDLSHFPELPMPEILHSLLDQAIAIVSELCNASKLSQVDPEVQSVCLLMLEIMEYALYLEFCVQQICGIRPVLGRVEDFAKEFRSLLIAIERHAFLKESAKSLKQIVSLIYPGLSQNEGFI